jgi:DNA-binding NarL/FixJ family response regulator
MRVVLIGPPVERARLRRGLAGTSLTIVGEAESERDARVVGLSADAYLTASRTGDVPRPAAFTLHDDPNDAALAEPLTPREMEVLELLAEGMPNKAIARQLDISDQTVKFHVAQVCGKLGAINRTDAVRRAVRRGLIAL